MSERLQIAVIGGGVAGLSAAWLLHPLHDVTLFERNDYIGGHTHTIDIPGGPDAGTPVDTGFIVLNNRTYPLLHRLLEKLGVAWRWSEMSFGYYARSTGFCYAGTGLNGLFAQRSNLIHPAHYRLIAGILRFGRQARADLRADALGGLTLGGYLEKLRVPQAVVDQFLIPMGAAIWSASRAEMLLFPAAPLLSFWENHGLLSFKDRPRWQTVAGGSHAYVKVLLQRLGPAARASSPAERVIRGPQGVTVELASGESRRFDRVIIATHADEALALLGDPSPDEQRLLGAWYYAPNRTVLHTDISLMPPNRRAWAAWNYVEEPRQPAYQPVGVTYWMNRLQGLQTQEQYLVSLNPARTIAPERIVAELSYTHPQFTFAAVASQVELPRLNGQRNTYFCGSYFAHGFHEDALRSGVEVARALGAEF